MELRNFILFLPFFFLAFVEGSAQSPFDNPSFESSSNATKSCGTDCQFPDDWEFDDCNPQAKLCRRLPSTQGGYSVGVRETGSAGCCTTYAYIEQDSIDLSGICEIAVDQIGGSIGNPEYAEQLLYIDGTQVKNCGYVNNGQRDSCYLDVSGYSGEHVLRIEWQQRSVAGDSLGTSMVDNLRVTISESDPPSGISVSKNPICPGSNTNLTVNGGKLGARADWIWYDASCGTGAIDTGSSTTVNPTSNTTYYVRAENSCNVTSCASVTVDTITTPNEPSAVSATPNPQCEGDTAILTKSGGSLGDSATWEWYKGSCGGTAVGSGDTLKVAPSSKSTYYVRAEGKCDTTNCDSTTLNLDPSPKMDAGLDRQFCRGDTIAMGGPSVSGGTTPYNFSWNPSSSLSNGSILNPDAFPDSTTDYGITVTDANGCTDTDSVTVTVHSNPTVQFSGLDSVYCANRPGDTLYGSEAPDGDFLGNGVSDLGNGEGYFDPGAVSYKTHEVYYRYIDSNSCSDTDTQSVRVYDAPKLNDKNLIRIKATCGNSDGSIENMLVGGGNTPYSFEWKDTATGKVVDSTLDLTQAPTGDYRLTVTDQNGCYHSLGPYHIGEIGGPKAYAGRDTIFCENDSATIGDSIAASDGTPPYEYEWEPDSSLDDSTIPQPRASPPKTTEYVLTVTDSNDCKARDTAIVGIFPAPDIEAGDTIRTCRKGKTRLGGDSTAEGGHPPYRYFWSNPTGLSNDTVPNPIASPMDSTVYPLYVTDSLGCDSRDTAWVYIDKRHCAGPHIFVPNAFSPNGDGVNDELSVYGKDIGSFELQIFNRWGQLIFSTRSKDRSWDGTYKGKHLDPGVYVYKVSGVYENGVKFDESGNITLLE